MFQRGYRRAVPILLTGALTLAAAGCGSSEEADPMTKSSPQSVPTARLSPPANPQKETNTVARGTTSWVGGLRLGVAGAHGGSGTVVVLAGYGVPPEGNWRVTGKAGHSEKLANGYTISIDQVVNAKKLEKGMTGSGGGSVTVTVTPPK
ncbi:MULTISPECIES: hypothetical protein [Actinomadura]|uniref:Lipoprotein n=1 Tax=Actinomadura miaoliensis TaxID=430685 RepID=A0ABP7VEY3_9ACTN